MILVIDPVVPTPVGVNRSNSIDDVRENRGPHARGGEPFRESSYDQDVTWSPRPWG